MRTVVGAWVPYTFTGVDPSLGSVAARYGTTLHGLWFAAGKKGTPEAWVAGVKRGSRFLVPVPQEEWNFAWESCEGGKAPLLTLADVCKERSRDPLREAMERARPLSPAELIGYAMNADLRARLLAPYAQDRRRLHELEADQGGALGGLTLPRGPVWIPYPAWTMMSRIAAAPTVEGRIQATADSGVPGWLRRLWDEHLGPIVEVTKKLVANAEHCIAWRKKVAPQVYSLHAFEWLLRTMAENPDADEAQRCDLEALRAAFRTFHEFVIERVALNPAGVVGEDLQAVLGQTLLMRLRSKELAAGVRRIFDGPNYRLSPWMSESLDGGKQARIQEFVCALFELAIRGLVLGYHGEEIRKDIEASMPLGAVGGERTAIAEVIAIACDATNFTTTLVGNLPGPQSLALSGFMVWMAGELPTATTSPEVASKAYARVAGAVKRVLGLDAEKAADFEAAIRSGDSARIDKWKENIDEGFQASRGWNVAMTLLSGLILLRALSDGGSWVDIAQSGIGVYLGTIRAIFASLKADSTYAKMLKRASPGALGVIASVLGVLSGGSTVLEGLDRGDMVKVVGGGLQAGGGILAIGGYLWSVPCLGLVGNVLMVVGLIVLLFDEPEPKDVCLGLLERFGDGEWFDQVAEAAPDVEARYEAFTEIAERSNAYGVLVDTGEIRRILQAYGFAEGDIDALFGIRRGAFGPSYPEPDVCVDIDPVAIHHYDYKEQQCDPLDLRDPKHPKRDTKQCGK